MANQQKTHVLDSERGLSLCGKAGVAIVPDGKVIRGLFMAPRPTCRKCEMLDAQRRAWGGRTA